MTDKNRDFSQIRVGTVVVFPQTTGEVTAAKGYLVIACGQERFTFSSDTGAVINLNRVWWERTGGYIVSQPEEHPVAEQASVRTREDQSTAMSNPSMKKQIVIYQDGTYIEIVKSPLDAAYRSDDPDWLATVDIDWPDVRVDVAEKRGDAAGYARRVAEEGGEAVYQVYSGLVTDRGHWRDASADDIKKYYSDAHWKKRTLYTAPQPDILGETIAELRLSEMHARADAEAAKAKVAMLRNETIREIVKLLEKEVSDYQDEHLGPVDPETGAAEYARDEMLDWETDRLELIEKIQALAATGDE